MIAKVTIGIPTYARPELLRRALTSVSLQDLEDIDVLVADNASPGNDTELVADEFRRSIPSLRYVRHSANLGAIQNLQFLLSEARTPYFMWLADDDEISAGFIANLLSILERDSTIACATGHWMLMSDPSDGRRMKTSHFPQSSTLGRLLRYVWSSDDAFFYGLHRTEVLRSASFSRYWWPNANMTRNWAQVFLFDIVASGRVLLTDDPSVRFINHDYTPKSYATGGRGWVARVRIMIRRLNVHCFYWAKARRRLNFFYLPLFVAVSFAALARDTAELTLRWSTGRRRHEAAQQRGGRSGV